MTDAEELELATAELELAKSKAKAKTAATPPVAQPVAPTPGMLSPQTKTGAAVRGFAQGGSYGLADEASGLMGAAREAAARHPIATMAASTLAAPYFAPAAAVAQLGAMAGIGEKPDERPGEGLVDAVTRAYRSNRADARREDVQAKAANPYTYGGAELAGAIAAPGPKFAAGSKVLGGQLTKAGARAATGVAQGAGFAVGASDSESPGGVALDALKGGVTGGVLNLGLGALGDKASSWLKRRAEENAVKALVGRGHINSRLEGAGYATAADRADLGRAALDTGAVRPFDKAENIAERVGGEGGLLSQQGNIIDDVLTRSDASGVPFDTNRAAWDMVGAVHGPEGLSTTAMRKGTGAANLVQDMVDQGANSTTFRGANQLKSDMYRGVNYGTDPALSTDLERQAIRGAKESIENQVGEIDPLNVDILKSANRRYGQLADMKGFAREEANRQVEGKGAVDRTLTALAAAAAGGPMGGMAGGTTGGLLGLTGGAALGYGIRAAQPRMASTFATAQNAMTPLPSKVAPWAARLGSERLSQTRKPDDEAAVSAFLRDGQ